MGLVPLRKRRDPPSNIVTQKPVYQTAVGGCVAVGGVGGNGWPGITGWKPGTVAVAGPMTAVRAFTSQYACFVVCSVCQLSTSNAIASASCTTLLTYDSDGAK